MRSLPQVMVAPNGARLTKADHPAIPVTIGEIVETARACARAGAQGIHAHVRDAEQAHVLDAGLYRELVAELEHALPGFYVQITSEAVGKYSPEEQRALVEDLRPQAVSIALREITAGQDQVVSARFFNWCVDAGVEVQHILYDRPDIEHLARLVETGIVPPAELKALLVFGRYEGPENVSAAKVTERAAILQRHLPGVDWAICAFGKEETECLLQARRLGGKARIGFENSRLHPDGRLAASNEERVAEFVKAVSQSDPAG